MKFKSLYVSFLLLTFTTSCQLIKENRAIKELDDIDYARVYDEDYNDDITDADRINTSTTNTNVSTEDFSKLNRNAIWYHPNPWWRIETDTFPVSKDGVEEVGFIPQYGFSSFINPTTNQIEGNGWLAWKHMNNYTNKSNPATHNWQAFIGTNKAIFEQHPEYLAEVDGKRLGYGKTSKLCVSNVNMQKLYIQYTKDRILKNPGIDIFSIEPSDGAGFCTCSKCSALGSVSNQVFSLANAVAKGIKKEFPNKSLGVLAYYTHAEIPNFKLEDNILVLLAPAGYQTIYSRPLGLTHAWYEQHKNIGIRGYLEIPQWRGEQPRINQKYYLNEISIPAKNKSKFIVYETGTNINTIIFSSLFNTKIKNYSLTWNNIYEKFLNDCFPNSKEPMSRLFKRWFNNAWANGKELHYSMYDINEATLLAKDFNEQQRVRDLKAYINYCILYKEFSENTSDKNRVIKFFDYIYNSSNRNIVNTYALTRIFAKYYNSFEDLIDKYNYKKKDDKKWIRYVTDKEIDKTFQENLKKYPPIKIDYLTINDIEDLLNHDKSIKTTTQLNIPIKNNTSEYFYSTSNQISIQPVYTQKDSKTIISIEDMHGSFFIQKFLNHNEVWSVTLPKNTLFKISQNRVATCTVSLNGQFIPFISKASKDITKNYDAFYYNQNRTLTKIEFTTPIVDAFSSYIISPK